MMKLQCWKHFLTARSQRNKIAISTFRKNSNSGSLIPGKTSQIPNVTFAVMEPVMLFPTLFSLDPFCYSFNCFSSYVHAAKLK